MCALGPLQPLRNMENLMYSASFEHPVPRRKFGTWRGPVARYLGLVAGVLALRVCTSAQAATAPNARSPLGVNLSAVNYFSSEQPFLNILKTGSGWITHSNSSWDTGEEQYLKLDANGYPITLTAANDPNKQSFTSVGVLLERSLPNTANGYYPAGQYAVDYDGQGTMTYQFDATLVSSSPGRDVISVAPSANGVFIQITSTDPKHTGNYLRNIRVVQVANEAALDSGQIFSPSFLNLIRNFRALRFVDWLQSNGSTLASWSNRPLLTSVFWGTVNGVPIEVAVQLANAISADAWLNAPVMADNNYLTQMATLVHGLLGDSQKAYVELSNEVWNGSFSQNAYSIAQGQSRFPSAPNRWYAGWEWYGMRVAQMADIWYGVYGPGTFDSRVVIVMAGQAPNTAVLMEELATPDWTGAGNGPAANHHIGAVAIAPYFFFTPSVAEVSKMLAQPDGGLTDLFTRAGVTQSNAWVSATVKATAPYQLPVVAYEGGQSLQGSPTYGVESGAVRLFFAANRDARMGAAYTAYLNGWKASGGTLFVAYSDIGTYSQYGEWGVLESVMQTTSPLTSAPPKWQAIQNFIGANPCWWQGCAATYIGRPAPRTPVSEKSN
jgi:hypothetical protein